MLIETMSTPTVFWLVIAHVCNSTNAFSFGFRNQQYARYDRKLFVSLFCVILYFFQFQGIFCVSYYFSF